MTLASVANTIQSVVLSRTNTGSKPLVLLASGVQLFTDVSYGLLSKIDRSVPSASSRIDRILMDHRDAHKDDAADVQKVAIVTGANSGIGFVTANALARAGYQTILACRNPGLAQEALDTLKRQTGLENFEVMQLDLASLESVDKFVKQFKAKYETLDILVNNAGVMMCPYSQTKDGTEMQFGTNHIGHFALTTQLLDSLKAAKGGARIVNVASLASYMTTGIDYSAIEDKESYDRNNNYAMAKLANVTFSNALARKLQGTNVTVNSLHPGSIKTNLTRHVGTGAIMDTIFNTVLIDAQAGALTSIYLALSPDVEGASGKYYSRCEATNPHPKALDEAEQDRLWKYSENLVAKKHASV
ncbi:Retinol dehydrogenase 14 [Linderina pennispora]|nr:Retinol dehydrogenase 14 [Linderina pennispora]